MKRTTKTYYKFCDRCDLIYSAPMDRCPECSKRLFLEYTAKDLQRIRYSLSQQKQDEDYTVLNTLFF